MNGRELENFVISRRIAEKRRAPLATHARNALRKATAKLVKKFGGDSLTVNAFDQSGEQINGNQASQLLQRGESVTLKTYRLVHEGDGSFFNPDRHEVAGEIVVKLPASK
jgi:hypothetical protein